MSEQHAEVTEKTGEITKVTESTKADPAAATSVEKTAATTAAAEKSAATETAAEQAAWTDKWREAIAGEDEAALKALRRFRDPTGLWNKIVNQEKVIRERTTKAQKPAEGATPEELAAWRAEVGLPAEAKGFIEALKLPDGRVLGDDDKPVAEAFAKAVLSADPSPTGVYNAMVGEYFNQLEEARSAQIEADVESKVECLVALRKEFGSQKELDRAFKHIELAIFDDAPEGLAARLLQGARYADGRLLGNDPEFMSLLAGMARKAVPIDEVMPAGTAQVGAPSRLAEIRKMRDSGDSKYWNDPAVQREEMQLIDLELKNKSRGQKAA